MSVTFRFSFGLWHIHPGTDPFGLAIRADIPFAQKLKHYKELGFDGV